MAATQMEQQFQILQSLLIFSGAASIHMRKPGDWYMLLPGVGRREKNAICSGGVSGKTPEEAVQKMFDWATGQEFPMEIKTVNDTSRLVRWNGFMWAEEREN